MSEQHQHHQHNHSHGAQHDADEHVHKNAEFFNQEAAQWESKPFVVEMSKNAAKAIIEVTNLNAGGQGLEALEIGCGTGLLSSLIAPHVKKIIGVDPSSSMCQVYNSKGIKNMHALCLNIATEEGLNELKKHGSQFNLVFTHMVLHHIPDIATTLQDISQLLAPNGILIISDIKLSEHSNQFHHGAATDTVAHHGGFALSDIKDQMERVGLTWVDVDQDKYGFKVKRDRDDAGSGPKGHHHHHHEHHHESHDHKHNHGHNHGHGQEFDIFVAAGRKAAH